LLKRNEESNGNVATGAFFFFFCCNGAQKVTPFFFFLGRYATLSVHLFFSFLCGSIVLKKKKMTTSITFFDGFTTNKWRPLPFFGGFVAKKVTAVMSLPSSMVAVAFLFLLLPMV
jgi:hypothetical protein